MSERYSKLFNLSENLYTTGSPVMIAAGALLKDNQTGKVLAQIKLRSISPKVIKAATVAIYPKDTVGNALGDAIQHQYLDLSEKRDAEFAQKQPIVLPNPSTRAFSVEVKEVIFTDNSLWTSTTEPWEILPKTTSLKTTLPNVELLKQYKLELGQSQKNSYQEVKDLWYCGCGAVNRQKEEFCHSCKMEALRIKLPNWDELKSKCDERLAEEKAKADTEAKKAATQAKKTKKIALIAAGAVVISITAFMLVKKVIIPANQYKEAEALLANGQYQEAIDAFKALENYKDSTLRIEEVKDLWETAKKEDAYSAAINLLEKGDYRSAINAFAELGNFRDSQNMISQVQEAAVAKSFDIDSISISVPFYDLVKETRFSSKYEYQNTYNKSGQLVKRITRGSSSHTTTYEYDDLGRLIKSVEVSDYFANKGDQDILTYTYNEHGLVADCFERDIEANGTSGYRDGNHWVYTYEYDAKGRPIKRTSDNDGYIVVDEYYYGENGWIIKEVETSYPDGLAAGSKGKYSTEVLYDAFGNRLCEKVTALHDGDRWSYVWTYEEIEGKVYSDQTGELINASEWESFDEVLGMPVPSSCISAIANGEARYTYAFPEQSIQARECYDAYMSILTDICGFELDVRNGGTYVFVTPGSSVASLQDDCPEILITYDYHEDYGWQMRMDFE